MIRFKKARDYDNTIFYLKKAVQLDPANYEPYLLLGIIYYDYKSYRELALENWNIAYLKTTEPEEKKRIMEYINEANK
jgi:tetratricopeptide (TPR) repeat protein